MLENVRLVFSVDGVESAATAYPLVLDSLPAHSRASQQCARIMHSTPLVSTVASGDSFNASVYAVNAIGTHLDGVEVFPHVAQVYGLMPPLFQVGKCHDDDSTWSHRRSN